MSRAITVKYIDEDCNVETQVFSEKELNKKLVFATLGENENLAGILDDESNDPLFILPIDILYNVTFTEEK